MANSNCFDPYSSPRSPFLLLERKSGLTSASHDYDLLHSLTWFLYIDLKDLANARPSQEWLKRQRDEVLSLDPALLRPSHLISRAVLYLAEHSVRGLPDVALLCRSHHQLNPCMIRILMRLVGKECTRYVDRYRRIKADLNVAVADWVARMDAITLTWYTRRDFESRYAYRCGQHLFSLPHDSCEACMISMISGNPGALIDIRAGLVSRRRRAETKGKQVGRRLMGVLDAMLSHYDPETEEYIRAESDCLAGCIAALWSPDPDTVQKSEAPGNPQAEQLTSPRTFTSPSPQQRGDQIHERDDPLPDEEQPRRPSASSQDATYQEPGLQRVLSGNDAECRVQDIAHWVSTQLPNSEMWSPISEAFTIPSAKPEALRIVKTATRGTASSEASPNTVIRVPQAGCSSAHEDSAYFSGPDSVPPRDAPPPTSSMEARAASLRPHRRLNFNKPLPREPIMPEVHGPIMRDAATSPMIFDVAEEDMQRTQLVPIFFRPEESVSSGPVRGQGSVARNLIPLPASRFEGSWV
ncbi:hypothetical protein B0I35DRAFT_474004 [Stachybotrys elegans]|uniref:Uncharacterized protein n=1 Tax=Stachybotrys elegans TaxID=80388 RepID=A0A8K0WX66_9HYPO|nr:hypothetical protein B0I35DRAFT_474004 [Stachybotrys elegans]